MATPGPNLDWLFWLLGALLAASGLTLGAWALFWDRAKRGAVVRRRCPRCWYDMAGTPGLKCAECGREAQDERQLQRSRRRWAVALPALLVVLGGVGCLLTPLTRAGKWWTYVPDSVLIYGLPWVGSLPTRYQREYSERFTQRSTVFWRAEAPKVTERALRRRTLLGRRAIIALERDAQHPMRQELLHTLGQVGADRARARPLLVSAITDPSWQVRWAAARSINEMAIVDEQIVTVSLNLVSSRTTGGLPGPWEQETFAEVARILAKRGAGDTRVVPALINLLSIQEGPKDWIVHPAVYRALADIGPAAAAALPLIQVPEDYEPWYGGEPLELYAMLMVEGRLGGREDVLLDMAQRPAWLYRRFAIEELGVGPRSERSLEALVRGLGDAMNWVRIEAADQLLSCAHRREEAIDALAREIKHDNFDAVASVADVVARHRLTAEVPVEARLRAWLTSGSVSHQTVRNYIARLEEARRR